ncbi:hypothetical protein [Bacillus subtilis]|uniref:hypothetical protein n=1 Tax=Bacillus subtilis TaxID=1423 RepID=UPI0011A79272
MIEIRGEIFRKKEEERGKGVVDVIVDKGGEKGRGKWRRERGVELGVGVGIISESVFGGFI